MARTAASDLAFEAPGDDVAREIRGALAEWFHHEQRDLPWRSTRDPYAVWISEAMLQQTRVEVVLDYWPRFIRAFPDVRALARATDEAVLEAWSGLGYYRRARALQAAARVIDEEHGGAFPTNPADVLALPGVGPYTAGAVLSIALDLPEPIVDGNVERVFARLFHLDGVRGSGPLMRAAWSAARYFVAREDDRVPPRVWNQALMELGALVCTPRGPRCGACPVGEWCAGRAAGVADDLPRPKPKRPPVEVRLETYLAERDGRWLVVQRPGEGLMAGMWEFPTVEVDGPGLFPGELPGGLGARLEPAEELTTMRHGITKHRITVSVRRATCSHQGSKSSRWLEAPAVRELALTGMARKLAERLDAWESGLGA
ncbi:MAG: A/G-specific adenine glycosylase [Planctomycetota bacterium]|nr:A/G-specific adenine glycosylase [Planctomycetota bacterium]